MYKEPLGRCKYHQYLRDNFWEKDGYPSDWDSTHEKTKNKKMIKFVYKC